jgi:hypothetical protein
MHEGLPPARNAEHGFRLALRTMMGWYGEDADGVPFRYDDENEVGLAYDTDPPRRVAVDFRISESVPIDEGEFRRLVKTARRQRRAFEQGSPPTRLSTPAAARRPGPSRGA